MLGFLSDSWCPIISLKLKKNSVHNYISLKLVNKITEHRSKVFEQNSEEHSRMKAKTMCGLCKELAFLVFFSRHNSHTKDL